MRPKTHKGKRYALAHNRYELIEIIGARDAYDYRFSGRAIWPYSGHRVVDCWLGSCFKMITPAEFKAEGIDLNNVR